MSVMFLSDSFTSNLALTLADILNNPNAQRNIYYDATGLQRVFINCRGGAYNDFKPAAIQCILKRLNYNAYCARYSADGGYMPPEYDNKNAFNIISKKGEAAFLKKLLCFIYQCDEDANAGNDVLKALKSFERSVMLSIIEKLPEYAAAAWLE